MPSEDNYWDWYDHGPGSVEWNNKRRKEEMDYKAAAFHKRMVEVRESEELREENKLLKEKLEEKRD